MLRRRVSALCAVTGLVVVLAGVSPAQAVESTLPKTPSAVVLDASDAMLQQDQEGAIRMDALKDALSAVVGENSTDHTVPLGVVRFGGGAQAQTQAQTQNQGTVSAAACQDVGIVAQPNMMSVAQWDDSVAGIAPGGQRPIGEALVQADAMLPEGGPHSMVVVAGGRDSCAEPPVCQVAQQLKQQHDDLVVHTIGMMADAAMREELLCVAEATGGRYADATTSQNLQRALAQVLQPTSPEYQFPEQVIRPGKNVADAPYLDLGNVDKPAHVKLTTLTREQEEQEGRNVVKVRVPEGYRLQVGGIVVPKLAQRNTWDAGFSLFPGLVQTRATSCGVDVVTDDANATAVTRPMAFATATRLYQGSFAHCYDSELDFDLHIDRFGTLDGALDIDMYAALVPEPTDMGDEFNTTPSAERKVRDLGEPTPAGQLQYFVPGTQPSNAPIVTGTVTGTLTQGHTQFFAVPVGWGQSLNGTIEILSDTGDADEGLFQGQHQDLEVWVVNSLGQQQTLIGTANVDINSSGQPEVFGTKYPVSYGNLQEDHFGNSSAWLGGTYYVAVSYTNADTKERGAAEPVNYRLTLEPQGAQVQGPKLASVAVIEPENTLRATPTDGNADAADETWFRNAAVMGIVMVVVLGVFFGVLMIGSNRGEQTEGS